MSKLTKCFKSSWELLKDTGASWSNHDAQRLGAALAYYTVFAIAPLFIIVLAVAGLVFGEDAARHRLFNELRTLVGDQGGRAVEAIVAAGNRPKTGTLATVIAGVTLLIGAAGVFVQLQGALNTVWDLRREPGKAVRRFIKLRLLSFAMVLAIGFLLLVSLVISAALTAVQAYMSHLLPQQALWQIVNTAFSLVVVTLLFAMIFKVLPDARIAWRDVWIGALLTAVLFSLGKFLLGLYLGRSSLTSVYGAAGSLVVLLIWVYYSSQILLFGAEFTRLYAFKCGSYVRPEEGAHFVTVHEVKAPDILGPPVKRESGEQQKAA
jgi:membrane protein